MTDNQNDPSRGKLFEGVDLERDFRCLGCGNCCRGPGTVWVSRRRAVDIAEHLGIGLGDFRELYVAYDWKRGHVLRDKSLSDDSCVFLDEANRCEIHAVKPEQCAQFPYKWRNDDFAETCAGFAALKRALDAPEPPSEP